jgi:hypothetical protein
MRLDFRAALVASVIANTSRSKEDPPFTPQMFMPDYEGEEETQEQSAEQMLAALRAAFPARPKKETNG